jgi:hypothetical protein
MQKLIATLLFFFLLSFSVSAQTDDAKKETNKNKKGREWKTGKVLDTDSEKFTTYGGSTTTGQINNNGTYNSTTNRASWNHEQYTYAIEGDDYIYIISRVLSFRWDKEAQLTVNAPIKYAVEKNKLYFIDENEREMKGKIIKKILKEKKE